MGHFKGLPLMRVQRVEVDDVEVLRKLAGHMGLVGKFVEGLVEFEVTQETLIRWMFPVVTKKITYDWYDDEFFKNLAALDVECITFIAAPSSLVSRVDSIDWIDDTGKMVF